MKRHAFELQHTASKISLLILMGKTFCRICNGRTLAKWLNHTYGVSLWHGIWSGNEKCIL
jgi:hypothetical protein